MGVDGDGQERAHIAPGRAAHALGTQRHFHHPMDESEGCLGVTVVTDGMCQGCLSCQTEKAKQLEEGMGTGQFPCGSHCCCFIALEAAKAMFNK